MFSTSNAIELKSSYLKYERRHYEEAKSETELSLTKDVSWTKVQQVVQNQFMA